MSPKSVLFAASIALVMGIAAGHAENRPSNSGGVSRPSTPSHSAPSYPSPPPSAVAPSRPLPPPAAIAPSNSNGFSRPGSTPAQPVAAPRPVAPASPMAQAQQRQVSSSSLSAYQAERANARTPPNPVSTQQVRNDPVYNSARDSFGGNTDRYFSQRTTVINNYRTSHPDVYAINSGIRPNYGIYDSGFLTGMMMGYVGGSIINNATWMHAQQHQPWYPAYRADLERQAVDNAELRGRITQMDAEIGRLRAQGVQPAAATSLPQGVDPALAIAPEAVIADTPEKSSHTWLWVILGIISGGALVWFVMRRRR